MNQTVASTSPTRSSPIVSRLSYASSEVAGQLIFTVISFYLLKFYTDVDRLPAVTAGAILLFARLFDAVDAPLWGIIFEKTHSRWGRSRPWFLWLAVPFAISGVLTFLTPQFSLNGRIAYAATTYVLCSVLYTGINTPVTSILSALTPSPHERITLTTFRMVGSKLGVLLVNLTVLALVAYLGHGSARRGFAHTLPLYAGGSIVLYLVAFRNLTEVVHEHKPTLSVRQSLKAFHRNGPWWIIFVSSLCFWIAFIARISIAPYFFQYVLGRPALTSVANSLDFTSLATILFLPWFCRRTSRRNVWALSLIGSALAQAVVYVGLRADSITLVMGGWVAGFLASGVAMAMPFSLLSDAVDYGEWKSGIRAAGMLTAIGAAFCLKAGSGLGAALPALLLSHFHYIPDVAQTPRALLGINLGCIWLPAFFYALAVLPVFFYHRFERAEPGIRAELAHRRALATALSSST